MLAVSCVTMQRLYNKDTYKADVWLDDRHERGGGGAGGGATGRGIFIPPVTQKKISLM